MNAVSSELRGREREYKEIEKDLRVGFMCEESKIMI
jgi:hypothetical protein